METYYIEIERDGAIVYTAESIQSCVKDGVTEWGKMYKVTSMVPVEVRMAEVQIVEVKKERKPRKNARKRIVRLSPEQRKAVREGAKKGRATKTLAREFKVTEQTIRNIIKE